MAFLGRCVPVVLVLLVAIGASWMLSACGSTADDARSLTKRQYIERFNELQRSSASIFDDLETATRDPKAAATLLATFDELIASVDELRPPREWEDEHGDMLEALRTMREAIAVLSRASAAKPGAITAQVDRFTNAQRQFEGAVKRVNATR